MFCCKTWCVSPIYICSFCCFRAFFAIVCTYAFDTFIYTPFGALTRAKLCLLPSLFGFLARPKLTLFCCHHHASPNIVLRDHLFMFLCCFAFHPCPCTLAHPYEPILPSITHPHHFLPDITKHDVRGNFPGHTAKKHALHNNICACLPCLPARPHPYTL